MALIATYFDESYDKKILCVAGYVFTKQRCRNFCRDWRLMLIRYHLPFFRMSLCAHGNGVFSHLSRQQRIAVATEAIGLIKKYISRGIAVSVDLGEFDKIFPNDIIVEDPYQLAVWNCLLLVRNWADENNIRGDIAYLFEAGHAHEGAAGSLMHNIFTAPDIKKKFRHSTHGFVDKLTALPSQAADLLAWQWYTERKRLIEGKRPSMRADLYSLLEKRHDTIHGGPEMLSGLRNVMNEGVKEYFASRSSA